MKFNILIILLHLIVLNASAQKYSLGLTIPFRNSPARTPALRQTSIFNYGLGVSGIKHSSHKFFYQIGLNYIRNSEKDENVSDYRYTSNGWETVGSADYKFRDHFLSVPIDINYKIFNNEKYNLVLSAGATFDWLVYRIIMRNSTFDGKTTYRSPLNRDKLHSFITFGVGGYLPINNKIFLLIKPEVLYEINEKNQPVNYGLSIHLFKNL